LRHEVDQDRRRRFTRGELKVPYEKNHSRVSIAAEVEQVRANHHKRIAQESY